MENTKEATIPPEPKTLCIELAPREEGITISRKEYESFLYDRHSLNFLQHMFLNTKSNYQMEDPLTFVFGKRPPEKKENEDGTE